MAIDIPDRLRDEDFATCLVKRYLATDAEGRARYSGVHLERIGGGGDRPGIADQFTAEDLLAVTMLSVRIEGYHALEILNYQAGKLNDLLAPRSTSPCTTPEPQTTSPRAGRPGAMGRDLRHRAPPREQQDRPRRGRQAPGTQTAPPAPRLRQPHQEGPQQAPHRQPVVAPLARPAHQ
jgi:hypothetical protein